MTVFSTNDKQEIIVTGVDIIPVDWKRRLNGDTILTSTWTADTGITLGADTFNSLATEVYITADKVGVYCIHNQVTTAALKTFNSLITITVLPKCP